jgi:multidrug efflux pump subunit AcrA (membrane-fusion protein)
MMAEIELVTDKKDKALTVPNDVFIVNQKGEKIVFVVKDSVAIQRIVQTGISNEKVTEVISGLKEGEKIVVMGQELLKDGMKVMVQKPKAQKSGMGNPTETKKEGEKKR